MRRDITLILLYLLCSTCLARLLCLDSSRLAVSVRRSDRSGVSWDVVSCGIDAERVCFSDLFCTLTLSALHRLSLPNTSASPIYYAVYQAVMTEARRSGFSLSVRNRYRCSRRLWCCCHYPLSTAERRHGDVGGGQCSCSPLLMQEPNERAHRLISRKDSLCGQHGDPSFCIG